MTWKFLISRGTKCKLKSKMLRFKMCVQLLRTKMTLQTELDHGKVLQTITFRQRE